MTIFMACGYDEVGMPFSSLERAVEFAAPRLMFVIKMRLDDPEYGETVWEPPLQNRTNEVPTLVSIST